MTTDELGLELTGKATVPLSVAEGLNLCDRILGEPARRRHLFGWLRAPGAAADEWLPVDGYYPGHKLVVVWHSSPAPHDNVYSELVPAHGFRLLELTPDELGGDPARAEARLRERIKALGAAPRRHREAEPRESTVARVVRSRPAADPAPLGAGFGALLGVVLAVVLLVEVYLGVIVLGFDHGQPLLAFAIALDACARALGTIAAGHARMRAWAWWCALGGSPVVALHWTFERSERVATEPAPLAGMISLLAMAIAALGGLVALAGG
jgi:hypothetical protein